jgi:hypothetical protein
MLILYGVVSECTSDIIKISGHYDSFEKIKRISDLWKRRVPLDGNIIKIKYKQCSGIIPDLVGKKVKIQAKTQKYEFRSNFEYNKGEVIRGINLSLLSIELDDNWSN